MFNKKGKNSSISRHSEEYFNGYSYAQEVEKNLLKNAVQPKRNDDSLFNQINSIMNGTKAKYTSVQAAVDDMMQRSGLTAYLQANREHEQTKQSSSKVSQAQNNNLPKIMQEKPSIYKTLCNIIENTKGNLSVPAVIAKLHSFHANDVPDESGWEDESLIRLVSKLNLKAKADNPVSYDNYDDLGKGNDGRDIDIDVSNTDAFNSLMPAKL